MKKFNKEYFNLWKEPLLFIGFYFYAFTRKKQINNINNNKILIVTPCLIGEFSAVIPSIRDFIIRNKNNTIDILVTPQIAPLAKKIIGVNNVYTSSSVYGRKEGHKNYNQTFDSYKKIIVLRIGSDTLEILKNLDVKNVKTNFINFVKYGVHLVWNLILGKVPKRWRTFNFEMLEGEDRRNNFEDIFNFNESDYKNLEAFTFLNSNKQKIVIHTTTNWKSKNWDKDKWVALLKKINNFDDFEFIFVGSKEDEENYKYISSKLNFTIHSLINKTNLVDLLLIFRKTNYFIGVDSGPSNLADLAEIKSITMIGVSPNMYFPINTNNIVLDKTNQRGILQMFFSFENSFINKINVNEVYDSFIKIYNKVI